jgi:hypothetical protein
MDGKFICVACTPCALLLILCSVVQLIPHSSDHMPTVEVAKYGRRVELCMNCEWDLSRKHANGHTGLVSYNLGMGRNNI